MKPGDRVRLSARGLRAARKTHGGKKFPLKRLGTLHGANAYAAMVIWDGRRSIDKIPLVAVELAEAA